jgi:hypothetical protein
MKVQIVETIEITDEQRFKLGALLSEKVKPKRQATRDEIKKFAWLRGSSWHDALESEWDSVFGEEEEPVEELDLGDLI